MPEKPLPGREAHHKRILEEADFTGSIMPPPDAVKSGKVEPLTDEDHLTLVRWIDLGCPIDLDFDAKQPERRGYGGMFDDQRPTLTLTQPQSGENAPLTRILLGMHDYYTGLDMDSFEVKADFPLDGAAPGENLASKFKEVSQGIWELRLARAIDTLPRGKVSVSVRDRQGNVSQLERMLLIGGATR